MALENPAPAAPADPGGATSPPPGRPKAASAPPGGSATGEAVERGGHLLPQGIEIFRAGTHRDDAGNTHTFGQEHLAEMAAGYNAQLREAPLTVGHPKDNLPAYGWVKRVFINADGNLAVDPHQVDPAFAQMVQAGRFKKRSASFYPPGAPHNPTPGKWYLRHVAFLGAQPPAVAGLKDMSFADSGEHVSFSEEDAGEPATPSTQPEQEHQMSDADKAELERLRADAKAKDEAIAKAQAEAKAANEDAAAAKAQAASFAEKAAADRRAGFVSFAEAEVKAGRLLPKDKNTAVAALETLAAAGQPLSFAEGGTTTQITPMQMCAWLQGHMSSRTAAVSFGEQAGGDGAGAGFDARGKSDDEIDKAARRYQVDHPEVSYAEALSRVTAFTA